MRMLFKIILFTKFADRSVIQIDQIHIFYGSLNVLSTYTLKYILGIAFFLNA